MENKFTVKFASVLVIIFLSVLGSLFLNSDIIGIHFSCLEVSKAEAETAQQNVILGKSALENHDIAGANAYFQSAINEDSQNAEANFYYSITRVLVLINSNEFNGLLTRFGVGTSGRNLYNWTADFQRNSEDEIQLPNNSPTSEEVLSFLTNTVLPQIDGALLNLDKVGNASAGTLKSITTITSEMIDSDSDLQVDYGDVAFYKSSLNLFKGMILIMNSYNLNFDIDAIVTKTRADTFDLKKDLINAYPNLLTLKNSKLPDAKKSIINGIDAYLSASDFIRNNRVNQNGHLIIFDNEDLDGEKTIRWVLSQLEDSLNGKRKSSFTMELSQFLNLGKFFDDPVNIRELLKGGGIQKFLNNHVIYQLNWALNNLSTVNNSYNSVLKPADYPIEDEIEVDYGDIAIFKSVLYSLRAGVKVLCAYDMDVDIYNVIEKLNNGTFKINADLMNAYPDLLLLNTGHQLKSAKSDLNSAINSYFEGSKFIREETDNQGNDLITIDSDELKDESDFRVYLKSVQDSLSGPTLVGDDEQIKLDLTQFFDYPINLRDYLPEFNNNNEIISQTFPDPTFSGIFPDFGQNDLQKFLGLSQSANISPPSSLTATATSSSQITLGWNDNSTNETGFKIEQKSGDCNLTGSWVQIATKSPNTVAHTVSGLTPDTTYAFRVRAYNASTNSNYSNCAYTKTSPPGTLSAPTNLKATSASSTKINLTWNDNSANETRFKIYRKTGSGAWTLLKTTGANAKSFSDSTATNNSSKNSYQYYIVAYNASGNSASTNTATVPYQPTNLTATKGTTAGTIKLKWNDKSSNESGFEIYRKSGGCSSTSTWTKVATLGADKTSWIDTGLSSGSSFSYKIRAYCNTGAVAPGYGYSLYSSCKSAVAP